MKDWPTLSKAILLSLLLCVTLFLLINMGFRGLAQVKYEKLVYDEEVTRAFLEHDAGLQEKMQQLYGLEYQYFEEGRMVRTSHEALPQYEIARILLIPESGVLPVMQRQSLQEMLPYRTIVQGSPTIVFPVFSYDQRKDTGYLVFAPLFP